MNKRFLIVLAMFTLVLFFSLSALAGTPAYFTWNSQSFYITAFDLSKIGWPVYLSADEGFYARAELWAENEDSSNWQARFITDDFTLVDPNGKAYECSYIVPWEKYISVYFVADNIHVNSAKGYKIYIQPLDSAEPIEVDLSQTTFYVSEQVAATKEPKVTPKKDDTERYLIPLLEECAENAAKKPWEAAIYAAGAQDVVWDFMEETVTFKLRSFDLKVKTVSEDGMDGALRMLENAQEYDLEITLAFIDDAYDGFTTKSVSAMKSAITKAAAASEKSYLDKRFTTPLTAYLLPSPAKTFTKAEDILLYNEAFEEWIVIAGFGWESAYEDWAPMLYCMTSPSLSTKNGPEELVFKCSGADPAALLNTASQNTLSYFSRIPNANTADPSAIKERLYLEAATLALSMRKKPTEKFSFTFSGDNLLYEYAGSEYVEFIESYNYESALQQLCYAIEDLPDAPALDYPPTGRIAGSTSGIKLTIKAPKGQEPYYVQLHREEDDGFMVSAFVAPGKSCTIRAPKGTYYLLEATGTLWYGEELMFGDDGNYSRTESFDMVSSAGYTLTLVSEDGNMSTYNSSPDSFTH